MPQTRKVYCDPVPCVFSQLAIGDYFVFQGFMDIHEKVSEEEGETDRGRRFGVGANAAVVKRAVSMPVE